MSEDTTLEKHAAFRTNFPEGCHERAAIIQSLTASYNRSCTTMKRTCTAQERATKKRLFTDSETVKDCMLAVVDEVLTDDKVKTSVTSAIKQVPLSDTSDIRRVDVVATDVMVRFLVSSGFLDSSASSRTLIEGFVHQETKIPVNCMASQPVEKLRPREGGSLLQKNYCAHGAVGQKGYMHTPGLGPND